MPDGTDDHQLIATNVATLADIPREDWDRLVAAQKAPDFPFTSYDFLLTLETSISVRAEVGWQPHHMVLSQGDEIVGVAPLYLKGHSRGEFVFDHAWADAYERAGGQYYPKMLASVPFTPATGPRLLARDEATRTVLAGAMAQMCERLGLSSLHVNFPTVAEKDTLEALGYLIRTGTQYQFKDEGFGDWDGFLAALSSRKRKALRKEREAVANSGVDIDWITGEDITEDVLDQFWTFYQDTGNRKWGTPYLTRTFFSELTERMADRLLFIMARRGERYIAGAMNLIGGETLFGRYWGCTEHVPYLHFELCYYQAIDYALAHGLTYVDGGAQGEHKIARGYVPITTYSGHWLRDPGFKDAVAKYLEAERRDVDGAIDYLSGFTPFKKDG